VCVCFAAVNVNSLTWRLQHASADDLSSLSSGIFAHPVFQLYSIVLPCSFRPKTPHDECLNLLVISNCSNC